MIDGREHPHPAFFDDLDANAVSTPHLVWRFSLNDPS
jgi:hypothetical protein